MVQALNIGKNALLINQSALTVVGNNIANMNTEGYSKQRVNLSAAYSNESVSNTIKQTQLAFGVDIESISRYRDIYADRYYRESVSDKNYYDSMVNYGNIIENISNEFADTGLSNYLDAFYAAANNLSLHPTDISMKTNFLQQANNLANGLNNTANQLNAVRKDLVGDVNDPTSIYESQTSNTVDEINSILQQIADINKTIAFQYNTPVGNTSTVLDDRDRLLDKLSEYIPINVSTNSNNTCNVYLDKLELVTGVNVKGDFKINLGDEANPTRISFEDEDGYVYVKDVRNMLGKSGTLAAKLTLGGTDDTDVTITSIIDNLNKFANAFAQEVNDLQLQTQTTPTKMASAYYNSATGELSLATSPIFTTSDGSTTINASNITLSDAISRNAEAIATAFVEVDDSGNIIKPDEIGNNTIAQSFAELREKAITALNGQTFDNYNAAITADFGSRLSSAKTNLATQTSICNASYDQRTSAMGVSVEEELVDLIKYQRAYEASTRIFSVADEILQRLVNLGL